MKYIIAIGVAASAALPAHAAVIDDFNRPNAATLGPNYTEQNSGLSILDNQVVGQFASLSTYNGSSSTTAGIDIALRGADEGSYVALTLGYLSGQSYFIKVQDNDGNGTFDYYGFYGGNNDFNGSFAPLSSAFETGSFEISYTGTVASLVINANGGVQNYSFDYGYAPGSTDVGLGINRQGVADNLRFEQMGTPAIPEPATWAMMIGGFGMVGGALRSRRRATAIA